LDNCAYQVKAAEQKEQGENILSKEYAYTK
jgi:hypothetical protein